MADTKISALAAASAAADANELAINEAGTSKKVTVAQLRTHVQASTSALVKSIAQTGHGFSVGSVIEFDGSSYEPAVSNQGSEEVVGIVSAVADANNFTVTLQGYVTGLSSLTAGTTYVLSGGVGGLVASDGSPERTVARLIADSTTSGYWFGSGGAQYDVGQAAFLGLRAVAGDPFTDGSSADGKFNIPYGICYTGGFLIVADTGNNRLQKLNASDLSYVAKAGSIGTGTTNFISPTGICTDGTNVVVTDTGNHRIKKHAVSNLAYVATFGSSGTGDNNFTSPTGICTDGTHIWIIDTVNDRVKKHLWSDLSYVAQIGTTGSGNDNFEFSSIGSGGGITVDSTHIYVCDPGNHRIVKRLKADAMTYVGEYGTEGAAQHQLTEPSGISINAGILYVSDTRNSRIVLVRASDLLYLGSFGFDGGPTSLTAFKWPQQNVPDGLGYLYICDEDNNMVKKWLIDPVAAATANVYSQNALGTFDVAIANTETVVVSKQFAANELTAGMSFRIMAWFTKAGTQAAAATIRIRIGTTTLTGNIAGTLTPPNNDLAVPGKIDGIVTIVSSGSSGTARGELSQEVHLAAVTITQAINPSTGTVAVDTTAANQKIELTFISGHASNTYTFRHAIIKRVL